MFPGTFENADQCRLLWLLDLESTRARQTNVPFFWQSRCPTKLIDNGRKSSIAGADVGWVGCGEGVDIGVGFGVGVAVGTCVGIAVGDGVLVGTGVTVVVCPAAVEPQEASAIIGRARQSIGTIPWFCITL